MSLFNKNTSLWMGDLEPYMEEVFIKRAFTLMGEDCVNIKIIKNKVNNMPIGYCFVEFETEEIALRALHRCNGKVMPHSAPPRRFKLNHAAAGKDGFKSEYTLFVGDLSPEVDDYILFVGFSARYPSTKMAKVILDQNGRSKGYGFVRIADETEYNQSLVQMQGYPGIGNRPIRVSPAIPRNTATGGAPSNTTDPMLAAAEEAITAAATGATDPYTAYYQQYEQQFQNVQNGSGAANPAAAMAAYYQGAWPGAGDYSQYWAQYAQYYGMMPPMGDYSQMGGGGSGAPPMNPYEQQQQMYNQNSSQQNAASSSGTFEVEPDDCVLEEYDIPVDVSKVNREFLERNDEFYTELDNSRWLPTTLPAKDATKSM